MTYILFILGFVFLIKGADMLVDGSSSLARKFNVPNIIIGLTIVSFGTSLPELIVNLISSGQGISAIGLGTVIGSNISNIALVLGITAILAPIAVKKSTTWQEIPYSILAALVLLLMMSDNFFNGEAVSMISRVDGLIMLIFFILFMLYTLSIFIKHKKLDLEDKGLIVENNFKIGLYIVVGLIGLYFGGQWVVDGAITIARALNISEFVISATIIAVGTSLPELVTSLVAAYRKNLDLAVGNIVGSNIFNILLVLGLTSAMTPIMAEPLIWIDIFYLIGLSIVLFSFIFIGKHRELERWQGVSLVFIYIGYIAFLLARG